MDFFRIRERALKNGVVEVYPDFIVCRSKDLMVRGKAFYALWDETRGLWTTDEYEVQRLVDAEIRKYKNDLAQRSDSNIKARYMADFSSNIWLQFRNYLRSISDSARTLDDRVLFSNSRVRKDDFASKTLPYPIGEGDISSYEELMSTLYSPEERVKLEWAIGSIIAGDSKFIQKFIVLYGEAGAGKSTVLNIIQKLFDGYYTTFEAKALASSNNAFATEVFKSNPLVAIQHDGDLSRIEDNTKLNSIISHEEMTMNEKYKPSYTSRVNCFLFMGTNRPVKITDAKSGIIRRLIDVSPTGKKLPPKRYQAIMTQIDFELGGIAHHCLQVYRNMGRDYYNAYRPVDMILQTDVFYNFVEAHYSMFHKEDGVSLTHAYDLYKRYCEDSLVDYKLARHKFREELKNYFSEFHDITRIDGQQVRSYYTGFISDKFTQMTNESPEEEFNSLSLFSTESLLDDLLARQPAQLATADDTPSKKWDGVETTLSDIDTSKVHFVKVPKNHIVIDFDLKDETGNKSFDLNLREASRWPKTYAEVSKGGNGIHLHYIYDGDTDRLAREYSDGIEIKVFTGNASLRRRLTLCNNIEVSTISSGLPTREKKVIDKNVVITEKGIRSLIERNIRKEIHPGTKPSIDFIKKILDDAQAAGVPYDVSDMKMKVLTFAMNSSNQSSYCVSAVNSMRFKSEEPRATTLENDDRPIAFFDLEVYPNLFVACWKLDGSDTVNRLVNPSSKEVAKLLDMKLVGFNNRRYDNHILYGAYMGLDTTALYRQSQSIISGSRQGFFSEAYNVSHADIYDFATKKQSLKKWEVELGLPHKEMSIPWDEPVPEELIQQVVEYCVNDVLATESVFHARKSDYDARCILASISGLPVNETTRSHASKIIFGNDRDPSKHFVYTDLSEMFPGYKHEYGRSTYRGEITGEGGYVYAEPGIHYNVALLDVASMHPTSIESLNLFGKYTERFSDIKAARLAVKHRDWDEAGRLLDGALKPYLNEDSADGLSNSLKIVINSVYGFTSAKFKNPFRDDRNIDNIVAKRGSLFMIDLKHAVQEQGYTVAHIKTDSIKIPNATPEIIEFVMDFGRSYGYEFEHEATYERMCLVNNAVYIAKYSDEKGPGKWVAVGAQFQHPYVFKTLFSKEPIVFEDLCETKSVATAMYIDHGIEEERDLTFIGKVGKFVPVVPSAGGGSLVRSKDDKFYAVSDTKGYKWLEAEVAKARGGKDIVDMSYFDELLDLALENISNFGDPEAFRL